MGWDGDGDGPLKRTDRLFSTPFLSCFFNRSQITASSSYWFTGQSQRLRLSFLYTFRGLS